MKSVVISIPFIPNTSVKKIKKYLFFLMDFFTPREEQSVITKMVVADAKSIKVDKPSIRKFVFKKLTDNIKCFLYFITGINIADAKKFVKAKKIALRLFAPLLFIK